MSLRSSNATTNWRGLKIKNADRRETGPASFNNGEQRLSRRTVKGKNPCSRYLVRPER
jgi:hypothetical protein